MKIFSLSSFKKLWPGVWLNRVFEFDKPELFLSDDQGLRKLYVWLINIPVTTGVVAILAMKFLGLFSSSIHQSLNNPDSNLSMIYGIIYLITVFSFIWALFRGNSCIKAKQRHDLTNGIVKKEQFQTTQSEVSSGKMMADIASDNSKALYFSQMDELETMLHHEIKAAKNNHTVQNNNFSQNVEKEQE